MIPSAYGEYGGIKVVEYEKCIRETNTMSGEDFQELRRFNAHFFLLHTLEIGKPLMDYAEKHGIHPIKLVSDISGNFDKEKYPTGPWCKQGQWVIFARYAGSRLPIEGGEVRLLNDDEVLGTIDNPESVLHNI